MIAVAVANLAPTAALEYFDKLLPFFAARAPDSILIQDLAHHFHQDNTPLKTEKILQSASWTFFNPGKRI